MSEQAKGCAFLLGMVTIVLVVMLGTSLYKEYKTLRYKIDMMENEANLGKEKVRLLKEVKTEQIKELVAAILAGAKESK